MLILMMIVVLHAPAPVAGDEEDDPWNTETHAHLETPMNAAGTQ
jgi:hypothetical protein